MQLGDVIKKYREEHDMSLQDFANLIGSSRSYVYMLEKNVNPTTNKPISPSITTLKVLAKAMNMNVASLVDVGQQIYLDEEEYKKQFEISPSARVTSALVLVYGTIPAGIPVERIEDIIDTEEISESMLNGGKQYFGLKVKGNSMEPEYLDGDTLILEKVDDCENGDDAVIMVNGNEGTFKRVFKSENGVILQPLNPTYSPISYSNKQIEQLPVRIIGVVVEIRRKKRKWQCIKNLK